MRRFGFEINMMIGGLIGMGLGAIVVIIAKRFGWL
jgi:hypothetical protein